MQKDKKIVFTMGKGVRVFAEPRDGYIGVSIIRLNLLAMQVTSMTSGGTTQTQPPHSNNTYTKSNLGNGTPQGQILSPGQQLLLHPVT